MPRSLLLLVLLCASLTACTTDDVAEDARADSGARDSVVSETAGEAVEPLPDLRTLWDFRRPELSEERFREAAQTADARGERAYFVEALTQLARTHGLQERFDDAHRTLDLAEGALEPGMDRPRVRLLLERGRTVNSGGDRVASRSYFVEAYELATAAGEDALALDAAHMLGIVEDGDEQLRWSLAAIDVAEASEDARLRGWLGPLYNNTGWTLLERGDATGALELWEKGLVFRIEAGKPGPIRIARYTVARAQRELGRHAEALATVQAVLAEDAEAGSPDDMAGFYHEELAENLHALGRADEARPHFRRAHAVLSKVDWLVESEPERLRRLAELAE